MKMKLIPVIYFGFTGMDCRFSSPMLPWIVSEIRKRDFGEKLSLGVEYGILQAYNPDFELQFCHKINQMIRFSQADLDPSTFLYILKDDSERLLYCYMYQAKNPTDVGELYKQMKDQTNFQSTKSLSSANLTSLCVDISPSLSNFFEVLYVGKIHLCNKKVPETFIEDALEKLEIHKMEKQSLGKIGRLKSEEILMRRSSIDSTTSEESSSTDSVIQPLQRSMSSLSYLGGKTSDIQVEDNVAQDDTAKIQEDQKHNDHNRTMVLQIDRTDLRLISPDRKIILLHKNHKDVMSCRQGAINKDHFGFIYKDTTNSGVTGLIFKCKSVFICSDTVSAINQAFNSAENKQKSVITSCEHCPMVWFHKLCAEIENLSDKKTQAAILRKVDQLDEDEQTTIITKYKGAETDSIIEQNEFLMMLLRAHCEMKQGRHVHDTAENRSEFLNQYLGGGTIFMKAKKSLSNSLEMLKKRASRDDLSATLREMNLPLQKDNSPSPSAPSDKESERLTIDLQNEQNSENKNIEKPIKSPMMDIFFKVSSPKINDEHISKTLDGSWRQAIFKKVISSNKKENEQIERKSKEELREFWKKAIHQVILLARMEKENASLKAKQEESAVKRIKLEYDEMKANQKEISQVWDLITNKEYEAKIEKPLLLNAIRQGIPRGKRGDVWQFLAQQYTMNNPPIDISEYPNYNTPYEDLLKELTSHQHAILIDLGRTFPNHSYFSSPLGPGQLALFNLLKAYSLIDPEVGYCQGLSFVVGVLLLHMEESQAFLLLRHLMFERGLRKQYLPDMTGLQIRLYQLSRLLHDKLPDLNDHFNKYDVAPTLYAAPWILTIFASQFPLGFVTRVFDLLFMEGLDIVFRVALSLLSLHKEKLFKCDGFEDIMDYLKNSLTQIEKPILEEIIKTVYLTDISKILSEYKVEYHVLQEEMMAVQPQIEQIEKLETENKRIKEHNKKVLSQLELSLSNVQRLEKGRTVQQMELNRQEMHIRGLEVTVATLGNFINSLTEDRKDIEIPGDVRRIVSQIMFMEKRKSGTNVNLPQKNQPPNKLLIKSLSTGRIQTTNVNIDEIRFNSLNEQTKIDLQNNIQRTSNFFSNQHSNILKQKVYNSISPTLSNNSIDMTIQENDCEENEKNNNFNETIPITPTSPNNNSHTITQTTTESTISQELDNHPLSNCDVPFTFNGTRELRHIKNMRGLSRNSSPNLINPQ